jgi:spore coat polysaccharide biosynthesis protein SpsF
MSESKNVVIGIQARSTSERFPRKVFADICGKPMLQHVIDACDSSALKVNRDRAYNRLTAQVVLLVPTGDEIVERFRGKVPIFEGPEHDVLSRYAQMAEKYQADFIVRVTGDCPLIPPPLISKHITTAVLNRYDYCSNVDEEIRTSPDGFDCEVISRRLLNYANETAQSPRFREHVTLFMRETPPAWAVTGHVNNYVDLSGQKWSVDTQEDLERVRAQYESKESKRTRGLAIHGRRSIHMF